MDTSLQEVVSTNHHQRPLWTRPCKRWSVPTTTSDHCGHVPARGGQYQPPPATTVDTSLQEVVSTNHHQRPLWTRPCKRWSVPTTTSDHCGHVPARGGQYQPPPATTVDTSLQEVVSTNHHQRPLWTRPCKRWSVPTTTSDHCGHVPARGGQYQPPPATTVDTSLQEVVSTNHHQRPLWTRPCKRWSVPTTTSDHCGHVPARGGQYQPPPATTVDTSLQEVVSTNHHQRPLWTRPCKRWSVPTTTSDHCGHVPARGGQYQPPPATTVDTSLQEVVSTNHHQRPLWTRPCKRWSVPTTTSDHCGHVPARGGQYQPPPATTVDTSLQEVVSTNHHQRPLWTRPCKRWSVPTTTSDHCGHVPARGGQYQPPPATTVDTSLQEVVSTNHHQRPLWTRPCKRWSVPTTTSDHCGHVPARGGQYQPPPATTVDTSLQEVVSTNHHQRPLWTRPCKRWSVPTTTSDHCGHVPARGGQYQPPPATTVDTSLQEVVSTNHHQRPLWTPPCKRWSVPTTTSDHCGHLPARGGQYQPPPATTVDTSLQEVVSTNHHQRPLWTPPCKRWSVPTTTSDHCGHVPARGGQYQPPPATTVDTSLHEVVSTNHHQRPLWTHPCTRWSVPTTTSDHCGHIPARGGQYQPPPATTVDTSLQEVVSTNHHQRPLWTHPCKRWSVPTTTSDHCGHIPARGGQYQPPPATTVDTSLQEVVSTNHHQRPLWTHPCKRWSVPTTTSDHCGHIPARGGQYQPPPATTVDTSLQEVVSTNHHQRPLWTHPCKRWSVPTTTSDHCGHIPARGGQYQPPPAITVDTSLQEVVSTNHHQRSLWTHPCKRWSVPTTTSDHCGHIPARGGQYQPPPATTVDTSLQEVVSTNHHQRPLWTHPCKRWLVPTTTSDHCGHIPARGGQYQPPPATTVDTSLQEVVSTNHYQRSLWTHPCKRWLVPTTTSDHCGHIPARGG